MPHQGPKEKDFPNPSPFVYEAVCVERVKRLEQKITLVFGSTLVTIILIVIQLVRGI